MLTTSKRIIGGAFIAVVFFGLTSTNLAISKTEELQEEKIRTEISKQVSETEKNKTDREKIKHEIEKIKAETEQIKSKWRFFWQIILPSLTVPVAAAGAIITWTNQINENKLNRQTIESQERQNSEKMEKEEKYKLEEKFVNAMKSVLTDSSDIEILGLLLLDDIIKHQEYQDRVYDLLINKIRNNNDKNIKTSFSLLRSFEKALGFKLKDIINDNHNSLLLSQLSLSELILDEIKFIKINLTHSDFTKTSLKKAKFIDLKINKVIFQEANLDEAEFKGAKFYGVNCVSTKFYNVNMNNGNFDFSESVLKQQLQDAHFTKGTLKAIIFTKSNLTGVIFKQTTIEEGEFNNSIFKKTSFKNAIINQTTFNDCEELVEVNFDYAKLNQVTFKKLTIKEDNTFNGTNFQKTQFDEVTIDNVDFSNCIFDEETLTNIAKLKLENLEKIKFKEDDKNFILAKQTRF